MIIYTMITVAFTAAVVLKYFIWLKQDVHKLVKVSVRGKLEQLQRDILFLDQAEQIFREKIKFYEQQLQQVERAIYERNDLFQTMDLMIQDKQLEHEQLKNLEVTPQLAIQLYNERNENK